VRWTCCGKNATSSSAARAGLLDKETLGDSDLSELAGTPPRSPIQVAAE
jgi:hypothetical protein